MAARIRSNEEISSAYHSFDLLLIKHLSQRVDHRFVLWREAPRFLERQ
jgi:hypothetical protein